MSRLSRFEDFRFIGTRDTMRAYDCDDETQFAVLEQRIADEDLLGRNLLQSFAPDVIEEVRSRGFKPVRVPTARL